MSTQDLLNRQNFIELLKTIITNKAHTKENYSIAIDGEWGSGKTWILNEIKAQLPEDSNNKYLIFHYNAWENDFYEEPLLAIISVIIEKLNKITKQKSTFEAALNQLIKEVANDLILVVSGISKEILKVDVEKSIKSKIGLCKRIKNETQIPTDINKLLPLQNTLKTIRENIVKLAEEFSIIIMIDELDRCLPEYAIKVLERLHHICQNMPIIQITVYSGRALANSISKVYGGNVSDSISKKAFVDYYLEKFINLVIPLNYGTFSNNITIMFGNLLSDYKKSLRTDEEWLIKFFNSFLKNIPQRNRQQIFDTVKTVHKLVIASNQLPDNFTSSYSLLCCEIIIVMDRLLLHAQSHFEVEFYHSENVMKLAFKGNYSDRYSDIIDVKSFFEKLESFSAICQIVNDPFRKDLHCYHTTISDMFGIVLLTFVDGRNIEIKTDSYKVSYDAVLQAIKHNKEFLNYFYNILYQFFDSRTIK